MATVTLQQEEYEQLKRQASAYRQLVSRFFESITPGSTQEIVQDFSDSGLYTDEFLADLASGLTLSSLADKNDENKTPTN